MADGFRWKLEGGGGIKSLVAGPLNKELFVAASLTIRNVSLLLFSKIIFQFFIVLYLKCKKIPDPDGIDIHGILLTSPVMIIPGF